MKKVAMAMAAALCAAVAASGTDSMDNIGNVKLKGMIGDKLDMMIERHVIRTDVDYLDGDQTQVFRKGIKDGQIMPSFAAVRSPSDDIWMEFSATLPMGDHYENPEGEYPETVFFCDFASAGNTWRRDNYYRTWFPVEHGVMDQTTRP